MNYSNGEQRYTLESILTCHSDFNSSAIPMIHLYIHNIIQFCVKHMDLDELKLVDVVSKIFTYKSSFEFYTNDQDDMDMVCPITKYSFIL